MPKTLFATYNLRFGPLALFGSSIDNSALTPLTLLASRTAGDYSGQSATEFTITLGAYTFVFGGHDLTYSGGVPDSGTITTLSVVKDSFVRYEFLTGNIGDGLALTVAEFNSVFSSTDAGAIAKVLFAANDMITGSIAPDRLYGYAGDDQVFSGNANDFLYGGTGNDLLAGGDGTDRLYGQSGNDWLAGGNGNDIVDGGEGRDTALYVRLKQAIVATLNGNGPAKAYVGLNEVDILKNIENLYGGLAADHLTGDNGANRLDGSAGKDILSGKGGNDILSGGWDNDTLTGGPGADKFYFDSIIVYRSPNIDTITDFQRGIDKIYLDFTVFEDLLPIGALSPENFRAGKGVLYGKDHDYIVYNSGTGDLYFDVAGDGSGLVIQFAHLNGAPNLKASDFVVADILLYV